MKAATVRELEVPPLGVRLRYRFFSLRVPEEWREWAERDIRSSGWPVRESLRMVLPLGIFMALLFVGLPAARDGIGAGTSSALEGFPIVLMVFFLFFPAWVSLAWIVRDLERKRVRAIRYQRGEAPHPWRSMYGGRFEAPPLRAIVGWALGGLLLGGLLSFLIIVFLL